jgi:hypothetical protein
VEEEVEAASRRQMQRARISRCGGGVAESNKGRRGSRCGRQTRSGAEADARGGWKADAGADAKQNDVPGFFSTSYFLGVEIDTRFRRTMKL